MPISNGAEERAYTDVPMRDVSMRDVPMRDDASQAGGSQADGELPSFSPAGQDWQTSTLPPMPTAPQAQSMAAAMPPRHRARKKGRNWFLEGLGFVGEICLTIGLLLVIYVVWQLWWTGVVSAQSQAQQVKSLSWTAPAVTTGGNFKIAQPQKGDVPVDPQPAYGDVIGQMYVPRFGSTYRSLVVQGVGLDQLARHGVGHYTETVMPGGMGNFAVAGHRSGYGEPLADVDKFHKGDPIVFRTKDHWYVYEMDSHEIVDPSEVSVIYPVPHQAGAEPKERLLTLTTCTPRYTPGYQRWIVYAKFKYWANVSDGIPQELASKSSTGQVSFTQSSPTTAAQIPSTGALLLYLILALISVILAAAFTWGRPALRRDREIRANGGKPNHALSFYGLLWRVLPGIRLVRLLQLVLMLLIVVAVMFQYVCPWLVQHVPYLQLMSNYSNISGGAM